MTGEQIIEIAGIVTTAILAIIGWLARNQFIGLRKEVKALSSHVQSLAPTKETTYPRPEK